MIYEVTMEEKETVEEISLNVYMTNTLCASSILNFSLVLGH